MNKSRINVEVTSTDIAKAQRNDSYVCVVAQAIARTVPDATRIEVDTRTVRFTWDDERFTFITPETVAGYVVAFDAGDTIEPFHFQLRDPKRVRRMAKNDGARTADRLYSRLRRAKHAAVKQVSTPEASAPVDTSVVKQVSTPEASAPVDIPITSLAVDPSVASATVAYVAAKDELKQSGEKTRESDHGGRKPPRRVFKTKQRSYGHRLLRINQARDV